MANLRTSIESLANQFAASVLAAVRGASLEELIGEGAPAKRGPGRPARSFAAEGAARAPAPRSRKRIRRSANDIARVSASIVAYVAKHPKGIKGEEVRKGLGIAKNHWMKPLGMALGSKAIRKTGEKRATKYFPR
jgi:hypothetical protein